MRSEPCRRAAVLGGNRIPFARSNGPYSEASNQDMLTATLDGLVARFGLAGRARGRGRRPARCSSTRATSTSRASACSAARLDHATPAYDVQQACDTGLEAAVLVANKIALGQIDVRRSPAAWTPPATRRSRSTTTCARCCSTINAEKSAAGRVKLLGPPAPGPDRAGDPAQRRAAHGPVDGRARGA